MRKLILSFMILLGGIVNAQEFDFECETEIEVETESELQPILEYKGVVYNPNAPSLTVLGVDFPNQNAIGQITFFSPLRWSKTNIQVAGGVHPTTGFNFQGKIFHNRFVEFAVAILEQRYVPTSYKDFTYDQRENTLTFRGLTWNRNGNEFNAPEGAFNQDRYAGIGLRRGGDGRWQVFYQNNGLCPCVGEVAVNNSNSYAPGHHLVYDWMSFAEAATFIQVAHSGTLMPSHIFFADRNGPSVNHKRLTNWEYGSGFTGEKINGKDYPGVIRFYRNGDNWDIWLIPRGAGTSKLWKTNLSERDTRRNLYDLVRSSTSYYEIYDIL